MRLQPPRPGHLYSSTPGCLNRGIRARAGSLVVALACLLGVGARSAAQDGNLTPVTMTVGFTKASFIGVNQNDAEAAFKVFTQVAGKKRGYLITTQTLVFDNLADLEAAIRKEAVLVIIMDTWDYLSLSAPELVEPQFAPMEQGVLLKQYLLLTRRGSELNKLADLRGKDIEILDNANVNLSRQWLETILLENRLGSRETFFRGCEIVEKASAAVLPVFFGKKHACVVDQPAFDIMKELNPQVGKVLQVIAVSEPCLDGMIAFNRSGWPSAKHRANLYEGLSELHLEPGGQQILTLFKTTRLSPFKWSDLDTVRKMRANQERLRGEIR